MRFTLTIELGNAAMRSYADISQATRSTFAEFARRPELAEDDAGHIFDFNGNKVGTWEVSVTAAAPWPALRYTLDASGWPLIVNYGEAVFFTYPLPEGSTGDDETGLKAVAALQLLVDAMNGKCRTVTGQSAEAAGWERTRIGNTPEDETEVGE